MASRNQRLSTRIMNIGEVIDEKITNRAERLKKRLSEELIKLEKTLFTYIANTYIGRTSAPKSLSAQGSGWPDLKEGTVNKKGHSRFFLDTGDLRSELLNGDPVKNLGKPSVRLLSRKGGRTISIHLFSKYRSGYSYLIKPDLPHSMLLKLGYIANGSFRPSESFRPTLGPAIEHFKRIRVRQVIKEVTKKEGFGQ